MGTTAGQRNRQAERRGPRHGRAERLASRSCGAPSPVSTVALHTITRFCHAPLAHAAAQAAWVSDVSAARRPTASPHVLAPVLLQAAAAAVPVADGWMDEVEPPQAAAAVAAGMDELQAAAAVAAGMDEVEADAALAAGMDEVEADAEVAAGMDEVEVPQAGAAVAPAGSDRLCLRAEWGL